jgi:exodeoxyribonuclease X
MDTPARQTRPIPPGASAVANAPAFSEMIDRFKGADFYVAHNCEFERSFFGAQGIDLSPWICTYKCALRVRPELEGQTRTRSYAMRGRATPFPGFERGSISPHRTAFDAVVTAAIFEELIKKARWSGLVQWSTEPTLHTRFHFGK